MISEALSLFGKGGRQDMGGKKRGVSAGTVFMTVLLAVVLLSSGAVWIRLRSGATVDLSNLGQLKVMNLQDPGQTSSEDSISSAVQATAAPKAESQNASSGQAYPVQSGSTLTLTAAGTLAIEKNLRQSAYTSDTKLYDFTDMMTLLAPEIRGDLNTVFLENLLMDESKVSETVVPECAADMIMQAGFSACMAAHESSWEMKQEGVSSTMEALQSRGIRALGLLGGELEERWRILEANGIRVALMQYTNRMSTSIRRSMARANASWAVTEADADIIAGDIAEAKKAGAEICVVYLQWGKDLATSPTKEQRSLAKKIADAGADVIIGAGSRIVQNVEYMTANDERKVLCAWSLGSLMTDERGSANRIGGMLLHVTFRKEGNGTPTLEKVEYTPTYVWKYRQDSHYYYKCMAANCLPPDGMDSDQITVMEKALTAVRKALESSPVEERQARGNESGK